MKIPRINTLLMKKMRTVRQMITIALTTAMGLAWTACQSGKPVVAPPVKHMAESGWAGSAGVYADKIPNRAILQDDGGDTGRTVFYCLKIGLFDSADAGDAKLEAARQKYYQLDMYRDWVLIRDGDSIEPAFYQPVPHLKDKLTEQVLVFEIPNGFKPSALVYKDPYKLLGNRQTMLLHEIRN
jgi:hypothetical protein